MKQKNSRPIRISLPSAQGKMISLASGADAFVNMYQPTPDANATHIILGLGPLYHENGLAASLPSANILSQECTVYYLECQEFSNALQKQNIVQDIPKHWKRISAHELKSLQFACNIWWYKQNILLYPEYWSPILGDIQARFLRGTNHITAQNRIFLPGNSQQLLHGEICTAFEDLGYKVSQVQHNLRDLLIDEQPSLFFSINLRGLDDGGADFALLQALKIPVAIWFVDNPWHILSSLRLPWWKDAKIFVTDASFIADLKRLGAKFVYHLPLAAAQHMWQPKFHSSNISMRQTFQALENAKCIFVGRAAFPEQAKFFSAAKLPQDILNEALKLLHEGIRVDFHWWQARLQLSIWPGFDVRKIGLGAEQCACMHRVLWLQELLTLDALIFGDSATWSQLLPTATNHVLCSGLDYYNELAMVYNKANSVLNVTSLLLPAGLTQRHFDVWAAGGFLFSDNTPGLEIFPLQLVKNIRLESPSVLTKAVKSLDQTMRHELCLAWQECIRLEHSYNKRMSYVVDICVN